MKEIIRVVILPMLLMGGILGIFYLVFGRRIKERQDPPGVRTHATFGGFSPEGDEPAEAGQSIAGKLHGKLQDAGFDLNAVEPDNYGWRLEIGTDKEGFAVRVGYLDEREALWLLYVDPLAPGRGALADSPGLRHALVECHRALEGIGARAITWHRREDHATGHHDRGSQRPY